MAKTYKTPGVYIEETPKLPPSVVAVETALPAFVGYTEKADRNGEDVTGKPIRISSLTEFVKYYGADKIPEEINVVVDEKNNYAVTEVSISNKQRYFLYDSMRLFYDNGGGDCYIVSVGRFGTAPEAGNETTGTGLRGGVKALEGTDGPTIILIPDAVNMVTGGEDDEAYYSLLQMVLDQCAKLQNRIGLFDVKENVTGGQAEGITNFRANIGVNNLKYGAAYTPWIYSTYPRNVEYNAFESRVKDSAGNIVDLSSLSTDQALNQRIVETKKTFEEVSKVKEVLTISKRVIFTGVNMGNSTVRTLSLQERFNELKKSVDVATDSNVTKEAVKNLLKFCRDTLSGFQKLKTTLNNSSGLIGDVNAYAVSESWWRGAAKSIIIIDRNKSARALSGVADSGSAVDALYSSIDVAWLGGTVNSIRLPARSKDYGDDSDLASHPAIGRLIALDLQTAFDKLVAFGEAILQLAIAYKDNARDSLYQSHLVIDNIVSSIRKQWNKIPPGGAIAGVYARVDNARGVWKAPANESLNSVSGPSVIISDQEQTNLNVDAVAGKSIDAIRTFTGKGTLVWGARTLAGNDNEWRYINVRRFFNMVEASCKKSTEPFIFEPNDVKTWTNVKDMIENFLTVLWRQGALQGAKPEHAFYVAVGLGRTMTANDILEGRMIIEIGMAPIRPAEFIILRLSHKMIKE